MQKLISVGLFVSALIVASCHEEGGTYETASADADQAMNAAYQVGESQKSYQEVSDAVPSSAPGGGQAGYLSTQNAASTDPAVGTTVAQPAAAQNLMLIKKGDLAWETKNRDSTHAAIVAMLPRYGGYVSSDNESKTYYRTVSTLQVRVPSERFDDFVAALSSGIEAFDRRNISAMDVTEEFTDLSARKRSKEELENRYLALLRKADEVEDMLRIERELNQVRTDIERMEGRLRYLRDRVRLSSITLEFHEVEEVEDVQEDKPNTVVRALRNGWEILEVTFIALVTIWPLLLGAVITVVLLRRRRKRNKED